MELQTVIKALLESVQYFGSVLKHTGSYYFTLTSINFFSFSEQQAQDYIGAASKEPKDFEGSKCVFI